MSTIRRPRAASALTDRQRREAAIVAEQLDDALMELAETVRNQEQLDALLAHLPNETQRERVMARVRPLLKFKLIQEVVQ